MIEGIEDADEARDEVAKLPGSDGWWRQENGDTYRRLLDQLLGRGWHPDDAVNLLSAAYGAAVDEFGS